MAFDSDPGVIINTGTADNIGATIGTDFVTNQHVQLIKPVFGNSSSFTRVGADSGSSPLPTRLYQSGTNSAITSTEISGNQALDINIKGVNGVNSSNLPVYIAGSTTSPLAIQGSASGTAVLITGSTSDPIPITGDLNASISGTVGITNTASSAIYVQQATGGTFNVQGNLTTSFDPSTQIGIFGVSGATLVGITVGTVPITGSVSVSSIPSITGTVTTQNLNSTTDSVSAKISNGVSAAIGYWTAGTFTQYGASGGALPVTIEGLSGIEVTANIDALTELTVNNGITNPVPIQGCTQGGFGLLVTGLAGTTYNYPIAITASGLQVEVTSIPSISGTVTVDNISSGITINGGTLGVSGGSVSILGGITINGGTVGVSGGSVSVLGGITISGGTLGFVSGLVGVSGGTLSVVGGGTSGITNGIVSYLAGFSAGLDSGLVSDLGSIKYAGISAGGGTVGALLVHVLNPATLSGDLTIPADTVLTVRQQGGSTMGISGPVQVQPVEGASFGVTGDVDAFVSGGSLEVFGGSWSQSASSRSLGTFLMGLSGGVSGDLIDIFTEAANQALGVTLDDILSGIPSIENLATSAYQEYRAATNQSAMSYLAELLQSVVESGHAVGGGIPSAGSKNLNVNLNKVTLPTSGYIKTISLDDTTSSWTSGTSVVLKRGARIKCESSTDSLGIKVGFASGSQLSDSDSVNTSATPQTGYLLLVGEEVFIEIDNLDALEVHVCGADAVFTVIAT